MQHRMVDLALHNDGLLAIVSKIQLGIRVC